MDLRTSPPVTRRPGAALPAGGRFELWHLWEVTLGSDLAGGELASVRRDLEAVLRRAETAARVSPRVPVARVAARIDAGLARAYLGDHGRAATDLAAATTAARRLAAPWEEGYAAYAQGILAARRGETGRALARFGEACTAFGRCGDRHARAHALTWLADAALASGDRAAARAHRVAALDLFRQAGDAFGMLAAVRRPGGGPVAPGALPAAPLVARPTAGSAPRPVPPPPVLDGLTAREREVAGLIGEGLTNRQIARRIAVAERTVDTHVQRILAKLGCASRVHVALLVTTGRHPDPAG